LQPGALTAAVGCSWLLKKNYLFKKIIIYMLIFFPSHTTAWGCEPAPSPSQSDLTKRKKTETIIQAFFFFVTPKANEQLNTKKKKNKSSQLQSFLDWSGPIPHPMTTGEPV
jgi:hypothetical protein